MKYGTTDCTVFAVRYLANLIFLLSGSSLVDQAIESANVASEFPSVPGCSLMVRNLASHAIDTDLSIFIALVSDKQNLEHLLACLDAIHSSLVSNPEISGYPGLMEYKANLEQIESISNSRNLMDSVISRLQHKIIPLFELVKFLKEKYILPLHIPRQKIISFQN